MSNAIWASKTKGAGDDPRAALVAALEVALAAAERVVEWRNATANPSATVAAVRGPARDVTCERLCDLLNGARLDCGLPPLPGYGSRR